MYALIRNGVVCKVLFLIDFATVKIWIYSRHIHMI